ncbi:Ufd1-like [Symbiodinium microadriaticum]|nr:Ufd1-like [Symbiodinium microadriaticum]
MPPSTQTSSKDRSAGYLLLLLGRVAGRAADICGRARIIVSDENLCDWDVEIRLPVETRLGRQLADHKTRTQAQDFVLMRFHFPGTFPAHPPVLCCIRPRLTLTNAASKVPLTDAGILRLPELSMMHWRPDHDLVDIVLQVCTVLSSDGLVLDPSERSYSSPPGNVGLGTTVKLPTVSQCIEFFPASSLDLAAEMFPELADVPPGRVVLSQRHALDIYSRIFGTEQQSTAAFHVEIKNCRKEIRAFAGMAEVSALEEPVVLLPSRMMQQLFLEDGDPVRVRAVSLPLCGCVHLQPKSQDFYEIVGAEPELVLQESLARLPALTSGLSIQVEVAIANNFQIGLRRVGVVVARLEDLSGNDVLAVKLPGHAGVLGDHKVRVELLPAADLAESIKEHEARLCAEAQRQATIQQMLEEKHARLNVRRADIAQSGHLDEACELNSTVELSFRFPNGRQLRHRCPIDRSVSDLKRRLFGLLGDSDLWQPGVDDAAALEFTMFPRRVLCDADMVSQIGDRAVVHVTESLEAVQAAEHSKAILDSVVYPAGLEEAITSSTHDCGLKKVVAVDQSTYTPDRSARISPVREEGLETLPFAELRRLALTLGLLAADIARAVDKPELLELITQHQRRAARHARVRTHENAERSNGAERRASSVSARVSSQLPHPGNRNRSSLSVGARDRRLDSTVATPAIRQANFVPRGSTHSAPRMSQNPRPVYEKTLSKGCEVWYDKVLGKTSESNEPVRKPMLVASVGKSSSVNISCQPPAS